MGYGVMRTALATQVARLMTNSNSCTASFTQVAGIEALRGTQQSVAQHASRSALAVLEVATPALGEEAAIIGAALMAAEAAANA